MTTWKITKAYNSWTEINKAGMLETFIGKTETNEDITANNNINKVCSELQNAQRVGKKKR